VSWVVDTVAKYLDATQYAIFLKNEDSIELGIRAKKVLAEDIHTRWRFGKAFDLKIYGSTAAFAAKGRNFCFFELSQKAGSVTTAMLKKPAGETIFLRGERTIAHNYFDLPARPVRFELNIIPVW